MKLLEWSTEGSFQVNLKIEIEEMQNVTEQRTALHKLSHCRHSWESLGT